MTTRTVTITDSSISSLSGSSQLGLAASANRSYIHIFNCGNANVGVNLSGGAAVIGGAGTDTLVPNGQINFSEGSIPQNAINVIGTAGQPLTIQSSP